jgi:hypothetical protein
MSFLAPWFLLGAAAIALPIIYHLVRRSSKEHIPFSSLMFLRPTPPRVTKRNRVEHIVLLLLRCLVLGLLALGFARPFFQKPLTAAAPADAARKIVLLVDTSASMKRDELWPAAVARAKEVLDRASASDLVAVLAYDRQARSLVTFEQWSAMAPGERASLAGQQIEGLAPSWFGTALGTALVSATELFAQNEKQGPAAGPRQVVVVTDLQEGSRLEGLQGFDWPRGVSVQLEVIKPKRPTNAALQWLVDREDSPLSDTEAGPRVRVVNSAQAQHEQFQLRWDVAAGATPIELYVPPGQSRIIQLPKPPSGRASDRLILSGDDDAFDNVLYLLPPQVEDMNVLYIGDQKESDPAGPVYYLSRAFQQTRRLRVRLQLHAPSVPLPPDRLGTARLVIVGDRLPEPAVEPIRRFAQEGGTVLVVMKHAGFSEIVGRLAEVQTPAAEEVKPANYAMLGQIDFAHPFFAPFADSRYNDFTRIHFWKYRRLDLAQLPGARAAAWFDSGAPALLEAPLGKGRLVVLTSAWTPDDSQLAVSSKFVPLLYALLDWAGGRTAQVWQFAVGDSLNLAGFVAPQAARPLTVVTPDGASLQLPAGGQVFTQTDAPGVYTVGAAQPAARLAVNLEAAESRTAPLPIDVLERLGVPLKPADAAPAQPLEQRRRLQSAELEGQQKLWRWLTVAALMVLIMETWVAGWLTRRTTSPAASTI